MSVFGAKPTGERLARMQRSRFFRDGTFHNIDVSAPGLKPGTGFSTMKEFMFGGQRRTPKQPLPMGNPLEAWRIDSRSGLRVTWLGHSTLLVEIDGYRILTDPVWGDRASPSSFAGPKRFQPVPIPISALPKLDAVLVSHDHYDHLDHPTIRELAKLDVPFVTALGVGAHLEHWGVATSRITELEWWEEATLPGTSLSFAATPARHFSGRGLGDRNRTLWASWVLKTPGRHVFFSGDTGLTDQFKLIREKHGPFDLIMLEVGAFHPNWGDIHLGPDNAVLAHEMLGGGPLLPIHWGTFNLAMHAWDEPAERLLEYANTRGLQLVTPRLGEPLEPTRVTAPDPWWRTVEQIQPVPVTPTAAAGR